MSEENTTPVLSSQPNLSEAIKTVRYDFAASRIAFSWYGTSKSLSETQRSLAATGFGASADAISASKKLIDTKNPFYKELTSIRSKAKSHWKVLSLPYPEDGIRLIRRESIDSFNEVMLGYEGELRDATIRLDDQYGDMLDDARSRLGDLYDPSDYPASLVGEFGVTWDFPNLEPPSYLLNQNPELHEQQIIALNNKLGESLETARQELVGKLSEMFEHIGSRLSGDEDGKPKVFRDSSLTNIIETINQFRSLNVWSSDELDGIINKCESLVSGVDSNDLRSEPGVRGDFIASSFDIKSSLDSMMENRKRRSVSIPTRD